MKEWQAGLGMTRGADDGAARLLGDVRVAERVALRKQIETDGVPDCASNRIFALWRESATIHSGSSVPGSVLRLTPYAQRYSKVRISVLLSRPIGDSETIPDPLGASPTNLLSRCLQPRLPSCKKRRSCQTPPSVSPTPESHRATKSSFCYTMAGGRMSVRRRERETADHV